MNNLIRAIEAAKRRVKAGEHIVSEVFVDDFVRILGAEEGSRDATVGVHKYFLRLEMLVALHLVQNTNCEIFESSPGSLSQHARDTSRINLQTRMR